MKSLLIIPFLGALVYARATPIEQCQCPLVKCDASDAVTLCNCLNSRETLCKERCPDYVPTYRPCPTSPTIPDCECESTICIQAWPQSCHCTNAAKQSCFQKCGGLEPTLQSCPEIAAETLRTTTRPTTTRPKPIPKPSGTHEPCGGGRGSPYLACKDGYTCIKDPYKPGCGPECDGLGICVRTKMCGGLAGFSCPEKEQVCHDDPRDDCDPLNGGADCGGLCVWPH